MTLPVQHDRLVQLLIKGDATLPLDAARSQLERAAVIFSCSDDAANAPWGQAALLSAVACAICSFRGGVFLQGEFEQSVCVGNWMPTQLRRMLEAAGCRPEEPPEHAVHIHVGADAKPGAASLCCWADGWVAVTSPNAPDHEPMLGNEISGALAGALAVTEAFRMIVLRDLTAGKRTQRLSALTPNRIEPTGPAFELLPSGLWILGLGNLGQAILWILGLLPYADPGGVRLVLQDMDSSGAENLGVQVLTQPSWIGRKKARAAAEWAEARGFRTAVNELPFSMTSVRDVNLPGLALVGVDNIETRKYAARPEAKFDLVIDAGLGATPAEVFDIRIHGFPGTRTLQDAWPDAAVAAGAAQANSLCGNLESLVNQRRLDRCGALTIAGQGVGLPSTAVAAAAIQVAQACRVINSSKFCDLIDVSLANTSRAEAHESDFARTRVLLFEEARTALGRPKK